MSWGCALQCVKDSSSSNPKCKYRLLLTCYKSEPNFYHFVKQHWLLHIWLTYIVILLITTARSNKEVLLQILSGHFKSLTLSQLRPQKYHNSIPHELLFFLLLKTVKESPEMVRTRQWKTEEQREKIYMYIITVLFSSMCTQDTVKRNNSFLSHFCST